VAREKIYNKMMRRAAIVSATLATTVYAVNYIYSDEIRLNATFHGLRRPGAEIDYTNALNGYAEMQLACQRRQRWLNVNKLICLGGVLLYPMLFYLCRKNAGLCVLSFIGGASALNGLLASHELHRFNSHWLQQIETAKMRMYSVAEAKALRRVHHTTVFIAGLFIAAFVSIPILNFATPLFGTALMIHVYKRIAGPKREMIAAQGGVGPTKPTLLP
jgi:hypothetical protein